MIQTTVQMRILVAVEAVDFRNGIDGLARSGGLFVFRNRRRTAIKILAYDGQGFWLCQKRLSPGRFRFWPARATGLTQGLAAHQLQVLLMGGDPTSAKVLPAWRPLYLDTERQWSARLFPLVSTLGHSQRSFPTGKTKSVSVSWHLVGRVD